MRLFFPVRLLLGPSPELAALRKHNSGIVASGLIKTFAYKHSFCTVVYIFLTLATSGRRAPAFNVVYTYRAPAFNVVYTQRAPGI